MMGMDGELMDTRVVGVDYFGGSRKVQAEYRYSSM